jgi:hypothetical protein
MATKREAMSKRLQSNRASKNRRTERKENKTFLIYKEIQKGSGAKSYMTNGLPIYDKIYLCIFPYFRKPFLKYDFV